MPSDQRIEAALRALAQPREAFRSALVNTIEQVRGYLAVREAPAQSHVLQAAGLGVFAADRIDPEGFATLFGDAETLDPLARERIGAGLSMLQEIASVGDALFHIEVPAGADLYSAVQTALATRGRAFHGARTVEQVRTGRYQPEGQGDAAQSFPFRFWNRAERLLAPPLVVALAGTDLRPAGLAEFLDGAVKIVLLVNGAAPPAPLVRLISPAVFVMQTTDLADLERLAAVSGPAIAAVLPSGAATFVHDPAAGASLQQRLAVQHLPAEMPTRPVGEIAPFQQADELHQLMELAAAGPATVAVEGNGAKPATAFQPADKLAAWLLRQARLDDL